MGKKQKSYSTDAMAEKIALALREDLGLGHQYTGNPRLWQMQYSPLNGDAFKKHYQLCELLKKYSFEKDVYTQSEILEMSVEKFMANQKRLDSHVMNIDDPVREAVFRARGWIDRLLGDYDLDEHLRLCYWPKKASVGVPQRKATLENRWLTVITGSAQHVEWFDHIYLPWFGHAESIRSELDLIVIEHLSAVLVNKTYKSRRMIVPNSSIGGLYSNGLGAVMVERLCRNGYDVKVLPDNHKLLAKQASKHGRLATVDQSLASDNITVDLIQRLFPRRWARALLFGRIGFLDVDDELIETKTMSTMGIGFTFPMQMVVFLGLAHACLDMYVEAHGDVGNATISCFGDDLICPVELKSTITHVFESLGLQFNADKSFWRGPFRESCGGDYYHGFDVRPAYLPPGGIELKAASYEAWLYKSYNALKRRWDDYAIASTLALIRDELAQLREKPFAVPAAYGDDAGLKESLENIESMGLRPPHRDVHGTYSFMTLRKQVALKQVKFHACYMWEVLRSASLRAVHNQRPELDARVGIRGESGTYTECNTSVLEVCSADGNEVVPLKRESVTVIEDGVTTVCKGPPRYALASDKKRAVVKTGTAVRIDDGTARYATMAAKSFIW